MRQLDHHSGRRDLGARRIAELRGQNAEQRTEPLAARVDEVPRRVGDELVVRVHRDGQRTLDLVQSPAHRRLELGVVEPDPEGAHPLSTAALFARSISHCGNTPSATVTTTPKVSATVADQPGIAIVGALSGGSAKNISTTMRR